MYDDDEASRRRRPAALVVVGALVVAAELPALVVAPLEPLLAGDVAPLLAPLAGELAPLLPAGDVAALEPGAAVVLPPFDAWA